MLKERARIVAAIVFAIDLLVVAAGFFLAYWLRHDLLPALGWVSGRIYPLELYLPLLPLALLCWALALVFSGRYRSARIVTFERETFAIVRSGLLAGAIFVLAIYALRLDAALLEDDQISRLWIALLFAASTVLVIVERIGLRLVARRLRTRGLNFRTVLIVGTSPSARDIAAAIAAHPQWGLQLLGFVSGNGGAETAQQPGEIPADRGAAAAESAAPIVGTIDDIPRLVEEMVVDEVIFAVGRRQLDELEDLFLLLEELGIGTRVSLNLFPHTRARIGLVDLDGTPLLSFSTVPMNQLQALSKRTIDIVVSFLMLTLGSPVIVAIALGVKLTSKGPVLFKQERCGLNGRRFTLLKFRTMVADAEQRREDVAHLNERDGPVFKIKRDPRVTPFGQFLRKFSLDEIPQLWNVLRGDMSLVGPRPPIPAEVKDYERWQRRRLSMKPGLTCLWQVRGRNEVAFHRWMELDLEYIDTWSPWLDLKILLKTIPAVLSGRGAS
jgi:exopolysaccharide biosynthesis polyprenyl glycosylphosphotransferase